MLEPVANLIVVIATVLTTHDPVVLIGENDQLAFDLLTLQGGPVFEPVVERHAEIVLAEAHQYRCLEVGREANRILLAPDGALLPDRSSG